MKTEDFLNLARERYQRCVDAERENRAEAKIDLEFVVGHQWDPALKAQRENGLNPRPALVFSKLNGPIQQVSNEARQNRPVIKTAPIDGAATKDTSDVLQGIIRHITYSSSGDVAGEMALESAVRCSFGYFGFLTRYCDDDSFEQEVVFRTFPDPFQVYLDPDAKEPDKSDAQYAFVLDRMTRAEYKAKYPNSTIVDADFFAGGDSPAPQWCGGDTVLVAEYWSIETTREELKRGNLSRIVERRSVKQSIINGVEVLDETDWPGKNIPIIAVYGPEIVIDGKVYRQSLIRNARDPQRLHNFYKSIEAETIALAPRPKWVGAVGQFKTRATDWATAAMSNLATLQYDSVATNGLLEPPPKWHTFEPPVQALSLGALQSADDIKAATNIFDASLGARSNETSGKAIDARKFESDMANSHFLDNLSRAITFAGKQLIDLIPKVYDTPREVRIVGEDDAQKVVRVNEPHIDPETGKPASYMLTAGKYAVTVTTGPSYTTRRQEAFEMFSELSKAYPPLMQAAGDIILRNSDTPGADAVADRLKKMLPPNLADDGKDTQISPAAQAKLSQQGQMIEQLTATVHQLAAKLEAKSAEGATRVEVALINARASVVEALIRAQSQEAQTAFQSELDQIDRQLAIVNAQQQAEAEPVPQAA